MTAALQWHEPQNCVKLDRVVQHDLRMFLRGSHGQFHKLAYFISDPEIV